MHIRSILVPIDGSIESLNAAEIALQVGERANAKVVAESVIDSDALWKVMLVGQAGLVGSGPYMAAREALSNALKATSEALLISFGARAGAFNVDAEGVIDEGNLVSEIVKRAADFDLVIVGHSQNKNEARGPAEYIQRSSVCSRLAQLCSSPLLVLQAKPKSWTHARLIVNKATCNVENIRRFLAIATALALEPEIYIVSEPEEQSELLAAAAGFVDFDARVRIIARERSECDNAWDCALDAPANTLLVVTTESQKDERITCGGTDIKTLFGELKTAGLLIFPPTKPQPVLAETATRETKYCDII